MQHTIDIASNPTPINSHVTTSTGTHTPRPSTVTLSKRPAPETTPPNEHTPAPKFARGPPSTNTGRPPSQRGAPRPTSQGIKPEMSTCYICGCEFPSSAIASHEPTCLQKQKAANQQNQKKTAAVQRNGQWNNLHNFSKSYKLFLLHLRPITYL